MKLGKKVARPGAVSFKLTRYGRNLPAPPPKFGHQKLISRWFVLGNDQYGDCVWAGAAHETMLWNREASRIIDFTDTEVLADYSAVTGFKPDDPSTDTGTDMQEAASYRRKTGVQGSGGRHKVGAYLAVPLKSAALLQTAIYLFSAVGVGFEFPDYAMDEFDNHETWHIKTGGSIVDGHYVPAIGYDSRYIYVVTWGQIQKMTWGFYRKYADEVIAYLSPEMLNNNKSLEGFDLSTLQADLAQL